MKYGLVGNNIYDTYSPLIHHLLGNDEYTVCNIDSEDFKAFITARNFLGINLQGDYQKSVLPICDKVSDRARDIGCANIVVKLPDGSLYADNTDCDAFKFLISVSQIKIKNKQCFILGSGSESLSVKKALDELGAYCSNIVSRTGKIDYTNLYDFTDAEVFVNTTPVGQYPNIALSPVNARRFQRLRACYDLICYPAKTELMLNCIIDYVPSYGGLFMLIKSCAESEKLFTGKNYTDEQMKDVYKEITFRERNLLLIGFEGSGANYVGKELSRLLNRELIDFKTEFANRYGMNQKQYSGRFGEVALNNCEHALVDELASKSAKIIVCPGELMSFKPNRFSMKRNSTVLWIERSEYLQNKDGASEDSIIGDHKTYIFRQPLYIESSDYNFSNNTSATKCAENIIAVLKDNIIM